LDEAAKTVVLPDEYLPEKQNHNAYMKYIKIFERLSTKLAPDFEAIANLQ
jgi:gluconokinase